MLRIHGTHSEPSEVKTYIVTTVLSENTLLITTTISAFLCFNDIATTSPIVLHTGVSVKSYNTLIFSTVSVV